MNPLFLPNNKAKGVAGKSGIHRVRKILKYDKNLKTSESIGDNVPDPWYFNNEKANKVWKKLEDNAIDTNALTKLKEEDEKENNNPFKGIDNSTQKIRQMLDLFESSDQEFLFHLMEMLDDDTAIDSFDQQSILLEARLKLAAMIQEHATSSESTSKLLESLKTWFIDIQEKANRELNTELPDVGDIENCVNSTQLANLINQAFEKNEICTEQATHIHKSIIDTFNRQMRELKQEILVKEKENQILQHQLDQIHKNRRSRRNIEKPKLNQKDTEMLLAQAQRQISEQDSKINKLKSQIMTSSQEDSKIAPETESNDTILIKIEGPTEVPNNNQQQNTEIQIELETKIQYLNETISALKSEIHSLHKEIKDLKVAAIDRDSNYLSLERAKKNLEEVITGLNEKYEFMEKTYKKKIVEAQEQCKKQQNSDDQVIADIKAEYENKIAQLKEQSHQSMQQAIDACEKRHRMQMNDMIKSLESTDQSIALTETMKQHETAIKNLTESHKQEISDMKAIQNEKISVLTKQYEAKLRDSFKQQDSLKASLKSDIEAALLKQKLELETIWRHNMSDLEDEKNAKFDKMHKKLLQKYSIVENLNRKLVKERDSLRDAMENSGIPTTIPLAEDELDDELDEEEEEEEDQDTDRETINKEAMEKAIEKLKNEYEIKMNHQRDNFLRTKEWEFQKIKADMQQSFDEQMAEMRRNLITDLTQIREKISNSKSPEEIADDVDNLISSLLRIVEKQGELSEDILNREPMIKLSEANIQMEELNKKIIDVTSENELLRKTLGKLSNNKDLKNPDGIDIVKVMRATVAEEVAKINNLLIENKNLSDELEKNQKEKESLKTEKDNISKKNENLFKQIEDSAKENEKLNKEKDNLNKEKDDLNKEKENLNKEKDNLNKENEKLAQDKANLTSENESLLKEIEELKQSQIEMQKSIDDLDQLIEMKEEKSKSQEKKIEHLLQENEQLNDSQNEIPLTGEPSLPSQPPTSLSKLNNRNLFISDESISFNCIHSHKLIQHTDENHEFNAEDNSINNDLNLDFSDIGIIFNINPSDKTKSNDAPKSTALDKSNKNSAATHSYVNSRKRVSFESQYLQPPSRTRNSNSNSLEQLPENITLQDELPKNQIKLAASRSSEIKFKFTSLDGSENPFSQAVEETTEQTSNLDGAKNPSRLPRSNTLTLQQLMQSQQTMNSTENTNSSPVNQGFPSMHNITAQLGKIQTSQASLNQSFQTPLPPLQSVKPNMSRSEISIVDIPPKHEIKVKLPINTSDSVRDRIKMQMERSQKIAGSQSTTANEDNNINSVFLTPEADMIALQLSEVDYIAALNSRPQSAKPTDGQNRLASLKNLNPEEFAEKIMKNEIKGDPKSIEQYRMDLEAWAIEMKALYEQNRSLSASYQEITSMTRELQKRHQEIVNVLTRALDTAMSLAKGDAEHSESLIEKMQEQSAYLTSAIREKEMLHNQTNDNVLLLNERTQELFNIQNLQSEKDNQIDDLSNQLKQVIQKVKSDEDEIQAYQQEQKSSKETEELQKSQIDLLTKQVEEQSSKANELEKSINGKDMEIEKLKNDLLIASKETEVDMTQLKPFVIFSTNEYGQSLHRIETTHGFALQPVTPTILLEGISEENEVIHVSSTKEPELNSTQHFSTFMAKPATSDNTVVYVDIKEIKKESETKSMSMNQIDSNKTSGNVSSRVVNNEPVQKADRFQGSVIESQKSQNYKKRIQQLEANLLQKGHEQNTIKDELHLVQQHLFKLSTDHAKMEREYKKLQASNDVAEKKLKSSVHLVTELTSENEQLRKLVEKYKRMSQQIEKDMKAAQQLAESKNQALLNEMKARALLHDMNELSGSESERKSIDNFTSRHALTIARWEKRRKYLQEQERDHTLKVLQAMNLIVVGSKPSVPQTKVNKPPRIINPKNPPPPNQPGIRIVKLSLNNAEEIPRNRNPNALQNQLDHSRSIPSFEDAIKNASEHNRKLPKKLQLGIIANPLKT